MQKKRHRGRYSLEMPRNNIKREQFKRMVSLASASLLLGVFTLCFGIVWYEYYSDAIILPFYRRGNWVLIIIYLAMLLQGVWRLENRVSEANRYVLFADAVYFMRQCAGVFADQLDQPAFCSRWADVFPDHFGFAAFAGMDFWNQ